MRVGRMSHDARAGAGITASILWIHRERALHPLPVACASYEATNAEAESNDAAQSDPPCRAQPLNACRRRGVFGSPRAAIVPRETMWNASAIESDA